MNREELGKPLGGNDQARLSFLVRRFSLSSDKQRATSNSCTATPGEPLQHVWRELARDEKPRRHQRVVQFVGVSRIGPCLVTDAVDRSRIERAEIVRARRLRGAARVYRLRP